MSKIEKIEKMLQNGEISRREFIARISALGLTAAISPAMLAATARASAPKKGGRFRMGLSMGHTSDSLDPATGMSNYIFNFGWQLRNNLTEVDYQGNIIPELAESFEPSADASQWIFKLRKGVEFHNGKTLDAEDAIYSINHHRGKESKSGAKSLVDQIQDIKADGKDTVIFTLAGGNVDFPYILSDYHLTISPAGTSGAEWGKGIGTGGYILESFEPGVRAFTKRNPNYWKEGRAHFDEIETLSIADYNARTTALMTGKIDYMDLCELKTIHLLKKSSRIQIINTTSGFHFTMPMLVDVSPYDNNDVRLALKYAINREQIVKTVLRGYGTVGNDHPISPIMRFHASESELPQRKYDPEKAKFHLKKAGLEGHTFKLHTSALSGFIDYALLFKEYAAKAGINIELVREPTDGYWETVWRKKPFCQSQWNARPTEDMMFSTCYTGDADWNESHLRHKRFDELIVEARKELDNTKRREMYVEMQKIVSNEGGSIVFLFKDIVEAASDKVKYKNIAGNYDSDGLRNTERWWFEG